MAETTTPVENAWHLDERQYGISTYSHRTENLEIIEDDLFGDFGLYIKFPHRLLGVYTSFDAAASAGEARARSEKQNRLNHIQQQIYLWGLGDRPQSPPAKLREEERQLKEELLNVSTRTQAHEKLPGAPEVPGVSSRDEGQPGNGAGHGEARSER